MNIDTDYFCYAAPYNIVHDAVLHDIVPQRIRILKMYKEIGKFMYRDKYKNKNDVIRK
jgi:hypothetical protein